MQKSNLQNYHIQLVTPVACLCDYCDISKTPDWCWVEVICWHSLAILIAWHANALSNCVLYCTNLALGSRCINWLFCHLSPCEDAGKIISGSQDLRLAVLDNTDTYNILGPLYHDTNLGRKSPIFDQITHMHLTVTPHGPLLLTCLELFGHLLHVSVSYYFGRQHYIKNLQNFLRLRALTILVVAMSDGVV